jgi:hypothetical protein
VNKNLKDWIGWKMVLKGWNTMEKVLWINPGLVPNIVESQLH